MDKNADSKAGTQYIPAWPNPVPVEVYWADGAAVNHPTALPEPLGWHYDASFGSGGPYATSAEAYSAADADASECGQDMAEARMGEP